MTTKNNQQSGFAIAEGLLIIVLILLVGGVSYYVVKQNHSSTLKSVTSSVAPLTAKAGTADVIQEVNQKELDDNVKAEEELSSQEQKNALDEASTLNTAGDGYNVNF